MPLQTRGSQVYQKHLKAVENCSCFSLFFSECNNITERGIKALSDNISDCSSLIIFRIHIIGCSKINLEEENKFIRAISSHKTLDTFVLNGRSYQM